MVVHAEPTKEQEAFLGVLMPVLMNESHTASMSVDAVVMLFRKAKALILNLNAGGEVRFYFNEPCILQF